jgi:polar amino acid transport system substrate-binding protein
VETGEEHIMLRLGIARWLAAVAVAVSLHLSASEALAQEKSRLEAVLQRGKLVVATFSTAPPFCYTDDKGQLVGFDIDVARLLAKALFKDPSKIEFVVVTAEGRWPAIESGRADMGIATTTIYPDRAVRVAFTRPYVDSGVSMLVKKGLGIKSLADLNQDKYTIANLNNPQMADRAKRFLPRAKTLTFDTPAAQALAVRSGRAQGAQLDTPVADWYATTSKDEFEVVPELLGYSQNNAIFLKHGDFTWWLWLDTAVGEMRSGSYYGDYSEVYLKWFGKNPPPQKFYLR